MNIAILGTRGIPNFYGGFEQFAEYLSVGLVNKGHEVTVYNSSSHPFKDDNWNGVRLVHCWDPEDKWGTVGQFVYDLNCIRDARGQNFDIILQLGYTSNSIWGMFLPRNSIIITNMDGLEWKRTKFSPYVRKFLKKAESLAVSSSNYLISDSLGIQKHLVDTYNANSTYIPYGSHIFENPDETIILDFNVVPFGYNMLVARLEPENSIEEILNGVSQFKGTPFLVIGKHTTKYGSYLKEKYKSFNHIIFVGGVYDINKLNNLRFFSNIYFHGHTVGGTNPSLLEAMGSSSFICAQNNIFNKTILGEDALYFSSSEDVFEVLNKYSKENFKLYLSNNINKIKNIYSWPIIINQYENMMLEVYKAKLNKSLLK